MVFLNFFLYLGKRRDYREAVLNTLTCSNHKKIYRANYTNQIERLRDIAIRVAD